MVISDKNLPMQFQFTHPGRGATKTQHTDNRSLRVSIHAPREGCDVEIVTTIKLSIVSIHAPREGCDGG